MVFHWSLRDRKSTQVSRTLLTILAVLKNAVIFSTRPPTSKFSISFNSLLVTVLNEPIIIVIIIIIKVGQESMHLHLTVQLKQFKSSVPKHSDHSNNTYGKTMILNLQMNYCIQCFKV